MKEEIRKELAYAPTHLWIKIEGNVATIGVTDYAQKSLGEATWVDTPAVGLRVKKDENLGSIESVKATSEINSPVAGEVIEKNIALDADPSLCNKDPYGEGWIVKIRLDGPPAGLLTPEEYAKLNKD